MTMWLKQSTSVIVGFGPFVDKDDAVTLETGLASAMDHATTGIRLSKNGAAKVDRNSGTIPAYDAMGDYRVTLDATDTGTLGTLRMIFEQAATCLPVWSDLMVVPANVWDSLFGADKLQVDVSSIAAAALDDMFSVDSGTTAAAAVDGSVVAEVINNVDLGVLANVGSAQNKPPRDSPDGFTITWGETEVNTEDAAHALDGVYHQIEAQSDAGTEKIEVYHEFQLPGSAGPTEATFSGRMTKVGGSKNLKMVAWNWAASTWRQIATLNSSADDVVLVGKLFIGEIGSGANIGLVRIGFQTGSVALAATSALYTDQIIVSFSTLPQSTAYHDGRVTYDDSASNTNTELGVDGIAGNAVSSWAAVLTLLTALGTKRVAVAAGSSLTLSGNSDAYDIKGSGYSIALGGQSIEGAHIEGAEITGIGTATVTRPHFDRCEFGATTVPPCIMTDCGVGKDNGTLTGGSAGEYTLHKCYSLRPGVAEPLLVFAGLGASTGINNRAWSGGAAWVLDSDCTLSHEVVVGGVTAVLTGGADAEIRGTCEAVTIVLSASETVQFVGITGAITISGTATAAVVNLSGASDGPPTDTSTGSTVTDNTISRHSVSTQVWNDMKIGQREDSPEC